MSLNKERDRIKVLYFVVALTGVFITYGLFLNTTYNCDLLQNYHFSSAQKYSFKEYFVRRMSGGRGVAIIPYTIYRLLALVHIHYFSHQWVLQCISFCILGIAAYMLITLYMESFPERFGVAEFLSLMIGVISPAYVEIFCFCGFEQPLAFLFTVVALKSFLKKRSIKAFVFILLAVSLYQNYVICFLILGISFLFLLRERNNDILELAKLFLISFFTAITNLVATKVFCATFKIQEIKAVNADFGIRSIINKTKFITAEYREALKTGYGFYKPGFVLVVILTMLLLAVYTLFCKKEYYLALMDIAVSIVILALPPAFMYAMENPYYPLRVQVPLYTALSMMLIIQLSFIGETVLHNLKMIAYAIIALFMVITINRVQTGIADVMIMNKLEFYEVRQIVDEIEDYEQITGNHIDTVRIRKEDNGTGKYDRLYLNINEQNNPVSQHILGTPWSDAELLSFVFGRTIDREDMTEEEFSVYFSDFDVEKMGRMNVNKMIHFEKNILYWITV